MVIQTIKNICLYLIVVVLVMSNLFNYFYSYKHLNDLNLQWDIAIFAIAIELFLFSLYVYLVNYKTTIKRVVWGWTTFYLLINLLGVCLGYNLHTKGFMAMLFGITFLGVAHIIAKLWQKLY